MESADRSEQPELLQRGLTDNFKSWLNSNGYGEYKFEREDLVGGAYGGKSSDDDQIKNTPIIFIHGNSDIGVGSEFWQIGASKIFEYFLGQGYTKAELYTTTWGEGDKAKIVFNSHNKEKLTYVYKFIEAVVKYTGAKKVNVIAHSMGVTMSRRVLIGGQVNASETPFDLGEPLAKFVDTFVGIAGGNYGLLLCAKEAMLAFPASSKINGFYPGDDVKTSEGYSQLLKESNDSDVKVADHTFAVFSKKDHATYEGDDEFFHKTSTFPHLDGYKCFDEIAGLDHHGVKNEIGPLLQSLLHEHKIIELPCEQKQQDP